MEIKILRFLRHPSCRKYLILPIVSVFILAGIIYLYTLKNSENKGPISVGQLLDVRMPNLANGSDKLVELENGETNGVYETDGIGQWDMRLDASYLVYGDFNNDTKQDIATVVHASGGGSGNFTYIVIFVDSKGLPKYMMSKELGDRIELKSISYKDGYFYADMITQGPDEGLCCGTLHKVFKYKIENNSLVEVEMQTAYKLFLSNPKF